jgi:ABC-type transport system involved in multi-copper enzyme maturation permease subunit
MRIGAALAAVLIGSGFMLLQLAAGASVFQLGNALFTLLTWLAFASALLAGPFFTSDAISEEAREGTLGFLFLTDLRGHDVVVGKLVASSLKVVYSILALFPVLGVTVLMGGVSGSRFWKTSVAIMVVLCCSLLSGLFASACSRAASRAVTGTVALLVIWLSVPPLAGAFLSELTRGSYGWLGQFSPAILFVSGNAGARSYWWSLLANLAGCTSLFALTCWLTPRMWQERDHRSGRKRTVPSTVSKGAPATRPARRELMDPNPMVWLGCRDSWNLRVAFLVTSSVLLALMVVIALSTDAVIWVAWGSLAGLFAFLLYIWAASRCSRLFIQARQSGLLDLLLISPLSVREIVYGQWAAWARLYGLPLLILALANLVGTWMSTNRTWGSMGPQFSVSTSALMVTSLAAACLSCALTVANLAALAWFGMYSGLTCKTANGAMLKTFAFVEILPWFVISFLSGISVALFMVPIAMKASSGGSGPTLSATMPLVMSIVPSALGIVKDIFFILWSRQKLLRDFRRLATTPPGQPAYTTTASTSVAAVPQQSGALPPVIQNIR